MDIPAPLRQLPNQLTVARIVSVPVLCLLVALSTIYLDAFRNRLSDERVRQTRV